MIQNYISIDLETTGLDPKMDSIIEVGAVRVEGGEAADTFRSFVKSPLLIPGRITELTGIRQEDLCGAPELGEVLEKLLPFMGELPILGHSVLFDYSFLKRAAVNRQLVFEKQGVDTLRIARQFLPDIPSRSLSSLCAYYGIEYKPHRACEDAMATHLLYRKLAEEFAGTQTAPARDNFDPAPLIYRVRREQPATAHQKERLYQLIGRHTLKIDYDVEQLTRNQASRYTDQILAEYGRCAVENRSEGPVRQ